MCCFSIAGIPLSPIMRLFSRPIHVSSTGIFARMIAPGVQGLAYSMNLETKSPVAMILPLPVVPGSGDDALTFVDLSAHPKMFEELHDLFTEPGRKGGISLSFARQKSLVVHAIGSFVASYVPSRADFTRLDPQFRMPEAAWDDLPQYADYGFAVFQLAPGKTTVHPMGMTFPTREPAKLFFPTVHVHDGRVHKRAKYDHALYYQGEKLVDDHSWHGTPRDYAGLTNPDAAISRRVIRGRRTNADIWI